MPLLEIDLTAVGLLPEGDYVGVVSKLDYQVKTGEKWNADGTSTVDFDNFKNVPTSNKRLHYSISVPGKGNVFADFYLMENALGFIKGFVKACGVEFSRQGFDPESVLQKQVGLKIGIQEDPLYGDKNTISYYKV